MRTWTVALAVVVATCAGARSARADRVVVGLYAPSAPFAGPSDRLQYVTRLATHLSAGAGDVEVVGRVFARASDFQSAVRRGDVQFAVVDAPYAAALGLPYSILGATTRGGSATGAWHVVAAQADITGLRDLVGKTVAMPRTGHRELDFLCDVLLEGQVERSYFGAVTRAPDSFSAVTMVKLGRASAAFVPADVPLPAGTRRVLSLRGVGWPMFVALKGADNGLSATFAALFRGFADGPLEAGVAADAGDYRVLRAAFGRRAKRPVMVASRPPWNVLGALLVRRRYAISAPTVWDLAGE